MSERDSRPVTPVMDQDQTLSVVDEHRGRYSLRDRTTKEQADDEQTAELGRGGIGRVLLAFDESLGREVAIKELLPERKQDPSGSPEPTAVAPDAVTLRFLREARVTGQLEHPNIIPVYELGQRQDGTLYYTMKVVRGRTLAAALRSCENLADRLKLLSHFVDLCQAVAYAHSRGVVHRDIKPQNVMVGEFGETVVLDWGLAKVRGQADEGAAGGDASPTGDPERPLAVLDPDQDLTLDGSLLGTPSFMSPEQALGRIDDVDERSDVWSLGAVLYAILTGASRHNAPTVADTVDGRFRDDQRTARWVFPDAPPELAAVCNKALSRDKAARYASAKELADDVEAFMTGGRVGAYTYRRWELIRRFVGRHKLLLAVTGVALALLIALGATAYVRVVAERNNALAAERVARRAERQVRERWAEAQWEGGRAALARGDVLEARARLRSSLQALDSAPGRALWWLLERDPLVWRATLDVPMYSVAYAPDGSRLAASSADSAVYVYDVPTRALRHILRGHTDQVLEVAFAPDSRTLASGSWDGSVWLWDLTTGQGRPVEGKHAGAIYALAFSPDGQRLATASRDKTVGLWDVGTGREIARLAGHGDLVSGVGFFPDGLRLASTSWDRTLKIWDLASRKPLRTIRAHSDAILSMALSPDGARMATGSRDAVVRLWDPADGRRIGQLPPHGGPVWGLDFSPDGRRLATGGVDRQLRIWDLPSLKLVQTLTGHEDGIRRLDYGPAGRRVATASWDKSIRIAQIRTRGPGRVLVGHTDGVLEVDESPDGRWLATGSRDKTVRIWDRLTGRQHKVLRGHEAAVWGVEFSPVDDRLATCSEDGKVLVWNTRTWQREQVLIGHRAAALGLSYAPDGRTLASVGQDKVVRIWDLARGREVKALAGHQAGVWGVDFSPDGARIATASRDKTVRVWDLASGRELARLTGHTDAVWGVAFSPDGDRLATGSTDGTVRVWDWRAGTNRVIGHHAGRVYFLAWHPDGRRIGAPSSDQRARIWSLDGGDPVELVGHRGEVNFLRFSPDGEQAFTTSDDGTVRVWDADTGKPVWRAPVLTADLDFFSHRGWRRLGTSEPTPVPRTAWREAIEQRARMADQAQAGGVMCLATAADTLEIWDLPTDRRLASSTMPGMTQVQAIPAGCLALANSGVWLVDQAGERRNLVAAGATAIAWEPPEILVAVGRRVQVFSQTGQPGEDFPADVGVTALTRSDGWLVLGYREGNMELVSIADKQRRVGFSFEETPASPVARLKVGEMGTLVAGFANGLLGVWNLRTGKRLEHARLHGPVRHLALRSGRLVAASELGDHLVWNLDVFRISYCALLEEVWARVPVIWEQGRAVEQPPPADHACAHQPGGSEAD